ncbi:hypothetical protein Slin15195_G074290 [Septoria linicola]|uniref:Uncharacterized protein n=1 Tax=Septoria linicola TaxID=215465 RepID=A0A9Q9AS46_9PEZI|nr:hypothetical protein Slin14017_G035410 [Septoria linicola]USW54110.1 hypothetical protein Slin15195_G074290 [Septoria linicola]
MANQCRCHEQASSATDHFLGKIDKKTSKPIDIGILPEELKVMIFEQYLLIESLRVECEGRISHPLFPPEGPDELCSRLCTDILTLSPVLFKWHGYCSVTQRSDKRSHSASFPKFVRKHIRSFAARDQIHIQIECYDEEAKPAICTGDGSQRARQLALRSGLVRQRNPYTLHSIGQRDCKWCEICTERIEGWWRKRFWCLGIPESNVEAKLIPLPGKSVAGYEGCEKASTIRLLWTDIEVGREFNDV